MGKQRSRTTSGGFTLLELVLTIAIIGLLALLVMPRLLNAYPRLAAKSEGIRLRADLAYAQQLAIAHNQTHRVTFDTGGERVSIYRVEGAPPHGLISERTLTGGVDLVGCSFAGGYVEFNSLGEPSEGGSVLLRGAGGETVTVTVAPGTGLVTVSGGS